MIRPEKNKTQRSPSSFFDLPKKEEYFSSANDANWSSSYEFPLEEKALVKRREEENWKERQEVFFLFCQIKGRNKGKWGAWEEESRGSGDHGFGHLRGREPLKEA